ncbi:MAG: alpha/beta hydrolase fold domain-containing protein [Blastocatellia bacterium]
MRWIIAFAPEHRFPAPIEDATTAYRWLRAQGIAPSKMVIAVSGAAAA